MMSKSIERRLKLQFADLDKGELKLLEAKWAKQDDKANHLKLLRAELEVRK